MLDGPDGERRQDPGRPAAQPGRGVRRGQRHRPGRRRRRRRGGGGGGGRRVGQPARPALLARRLQPRPPRAHPPLLHQREPPPLAAHRPALRRPRPGPLPYLT